MKPEYNQVLDPDIVEIGINKTDRNIFMFSCSISKSRIEENQQKQNHNSTALVTPHQAKPEARVDSCSDSFKKHGVKILFHCCHLLGLRILQYLGLQPR